MAKTYEDLKGSVLVLCDCVGSEDAETVTETALIETLRYIAGSVDILALIGSASYTVEEDDEAIVLFSEAGDGFELDPDDWSHPNRLYVAKDADAAAPGIPYEYKEYLVWLDLKSAPGGFRVTNYDPATRDERPNYCWTINPDNEVEVYPALAKGNVVTIKFNKPIADYADDGAPEIGNDGLHLLVDGATLILKEWIREPDTPLNCRQILRALDPAIKAYKEHRRGHYRRTHLRLSAHYEIE